MFSRIEAMFLYLTVPWESPISQIAENHNTLKYTNLHALTCWKINEIKN